MKTIQTKPDCTLEFVKYHNGVAWLSADFDEVFGRNKKRKIIGNLSEITEEQAKELIDLGKLEIEINGEKLWADLNEVYEFDKFYGKEVGEQYKYKLKTIALSVGIEEKDFDKYLVIKL